MKEPTTRQIETALKVLSYYGTIAGMAAQIETQDWYMNTLTDLRARLARRVDDEKRAAIAEIDARS